MRIIADIGDTFLIEARIVSEDGEPIEGARGYFVDSGLDDWRRGNFESPVIGRSDRSGRLVATYDYLWGYQVGRNREPKPPISERWFSIVVRAEGYQEVDRRVDIGSLERSDGSTLVELGTVILAPAADPRVAP